MIPREITKSKDVTFSELFYVNGLPYIPTTATVDIFDDGGTKIVDGGACTIDTTTGEISYTFSSTDNDKTGKNYRILFKYDGYEKQFLFDVVLYAIKNDVDDSDLFVYMPELSSKVFDRTIEATDDGTVSTIVSDIAISDNIDYIGGKIQIYISDTEQHEANITNVDKSTGTITFSPAYSSATTDGMKAIVRQGYKKIIDYAFDDVRNMIRGRVGLLSGYLDEAVIKKAVIFRALYIYCVGAMEREDDKYFMLSEKFSKMFDEAYIQITAPYDTNGDGTIDEQEDEGRPTISTIGLVR